MYAIDTMDATRRAQATLRGYQYLIDVRRHAQTKAIERLLRTNPWHNHLDAEAQANCGDRRSHGCVVIDR